MRMSTMVPMVLTLLLIANSAYPQMGDSITPTELSAIAQQLTTFRNTPRIRSQAKKAALYREHLEEARAMDASRFQTIQGDRKGEYFRISTRGGIEIENEQGRENAIHALETMIQQLTYPGIPLHGFFNQEEDAMEQRQAVLVGTIQHKVDVLSVKENELLVGTTRTSLDPQRGFSPGTRAEATRRNLVGSGRLPRAADPRRNTWDLCLYRLRNVDSANYKVGEIQDAPAGVYRVLDWGTKSDRSENGLFRGPMYVLDLERLDEGQIQQIEEAVEAAERE